jgi:hypothetical protein
MNGISSNNNAGEYTLHLPVGGNNDNLFSMLNGKSDTAPGQNQPINSVNPFEVKSAVSQISGQPFAGMNHDTIV